MYSLHQAVSLTVVTKVVLRQAAIFWVVLFSRPLRARAQDLRLRAEDWRKTPFSASSSTEVSSTSRPSLFPARRKHPCAREGVLYFSRPGELGGHT